MTIEIRKLQKSKTGYYINLPKSIIKELQLTGKELIKITHPKGQAVLNLEIFNIESVKEG